MPQAAPPEWSSEELDKQRLVAIQVFRESRMEEPLELYLDVFDTYRGTVEDLLETTVDLTKVADLAVEVLSDKALLEAVRYLAGPPISTDDLKKVADIESLSRKQILANPEKARDIVESVLLGLDRRRFPWIAEDREPDPHEREAAALASAALMASQRIRTNRANESKKLQEAAVRDVLLAAGFVKVKTPRQIANQAQAPSPGTFCGETKLGSRRADLVVGLWDGRTMAIECKVSNSAVNSVKRLNNDAAVKAGVWRKEFGTVSVVPSAVLAGVFDLTGLVYAQAHELTLFWAHDLNRLTSWIQQTRP
jgi:hypothetical protein